MLLRQFETGYYPHTYWINKIRTSILSRQFCVHIKTEISKDLQLIRLTLLIIINKFLRISQKDLLVSALKAEGRQCVGTLGFFLWWTVPSPPPPHPPIILTDFLSINAALSTSFHLGSFVSRWRNHYGCFRFPLWSLCCYFANSKDRETGCSLQWHTATFATEEGDDGYWRQRDCPADWARMGTGVSEIALLTDQGWVLASARLSCWLIKDGYWRQRDCPADWSKMGTGVSEIVLLNVHSGSCIPRGLKLGVY